MALAAASGNWQKYISRFVLIYDPWLQMYFFKKNLTSDPWPHLTSIGRTWFGKVLKNDCKVLVRSLGWWSWSVQLLLAGHVQQSTVPLVGCSLTTCSILIINSRYLIDPFISTRCGDDFWFEQLYELYTTTLAYSISIYFNVGFWNINIYHPWCSLYQPPDHSDAD